MEGLVYLAASEKIIFLPKSAFSVSRSQAYFPNVVQAYIQPYSFNGRIKLILYQIRYELSVTIHDISTRRRKSYMADPIVITA